VRERMVGGQHGDELVASERLCFEPGGGQGDDSDLRGAVVVGALEQAQLDIAVSCSKATHTRWDERARHAGHAGQRQHPADGRGCGGNLRAQRLLVLNRVARVCTRRPPGIGKSNLPASMPQQRRAEFRLEALGDQGPVAVVGHDIGGAIAQHLTVRARAAVSPWSIR
jgi:hypothetical protein